jgi:hypothetical protein
MTDFTIRNDHVDVEQIMRQIRTRIKEKRGVDYTEEDIRQLAAVKLEKFLDPRSVRSGLVEYYRRQRPSAVPLSPPPPENFEFEDHTIFASHRLPWLARLRRLLNPILKLFFNPNPVVQALHRQSRMNTYLMQHLERSASTREELDALNFEVLNNIVLELTRLGIEVKSLKMRVEAMAARQEFSERRARAFEGMLPQDAGEAAAPERSALETEEGEARSRRRRRRRGRRRPEGEPAPSHAGDRNPSATAERPADSVTGTAGPRQEPPPAEGTDR